MLEERAGEDGRTLQGTEDPSCFFPARRYAAYNKGDGGDQGAIMGILLYVSHLSSTTATPKI